MLSGMARVTVVWQELRQLSAADMERSVSPAPYRVNKRKKGEATLYLGTYFRGFLDHTGLLQ